MHLCLSHICRCKYYHDSLLNNNNKACQIDILSKCHHFSVALLAHTNQNLHCYLSSKSKILQSLLEFPASQRLWLQPALLSEDVLSIPGLKRSAERPLL